MNKQMNAYQNLGFDKTEMQLLVNRLNTLLCNEQVHYQKLRNFHWNVVGADFFDLHQIFENEYNQVKLEIDEIAERIRTFGGRPISTMQAYIEGSEIKESTEELNAEMMVKEIINDYQMLFSFMVETIESAKEVGDIATEDLITKILKRKEKQHWMLNAFLSKQKVSTAAIEN